MVVLVTQGSGRAFSAGSDLKELAECSPQQAAAFEYAHGQVFAQLEELPQITVAAWQGYVLGGGLFLGVYHDFRVAAQGATHRSARGSARLDTALGCFAIGGAGWISSSPETDAMW